MIVKLTDRRSLLEWYNWFTDQGMVLGKDYHWSWKDNFMAVCFEDPQHEVIFILKQEHNDY